jgi:putative Mg2+ transporter-C (MgtC) family protein
MSQLSIGEMFLRIAFAFLAGCVVGWERERHGRPAGLRTNILACSAAAVAMMVAQCLLVQSAGPNTANSVRADPARLGAGILTGIGFLGAGTILRHENIVRGVTTAATLWFVTVLGLAFGSGLFSLGLIGLAVALIALFVLPRFERNVQSDWYAKLTVVGALEALKEEEVRRRIEAVGPRVSNLKLDYDLERKQKTLTCDLKLKRSEAIEFARAIVNDLALCPGVAKVQWA